jgi:hypothetical protein
VSTVLGCPCGNSNIWSEEVASILYTVELTRGEDGSVQVEHNGAGYETCDEGTVYSGNLWCRNCGDNLTESELVEVSS